MPTAQFHITELKQGMRMQQLVMATDSPSSALIRSVLLFIYYLHSLLLFFLFLPSALIHSPASARIHSGWQLITYTGPLLALFFLSKLRCPRTHIAAPCTLPPVWFQTASYLPCVAAACRCMSSCLVKAASCLPCFLSCCCMQVYASSSAHTTAALPTTACTQLQLYPHKCKQTHASTSAHITACTQLQLCHKTATKLHAGACQHLCPHHCHAVSSAGSPQAAHAAG